MKSILVLGIFSVILSPILGAEIGKSGETQNILKRLVELEESFVKYKESQTHKEEVLHTKIKELEEKAEQLEKDNQKLSDELTDEILKREKLEKVLKFLSIKYKQIQGSINFKDGLPREAVDVDKDQREKEKSEEDNQENLEKSNLNDMTSNDVDPDPGDPEEPEIPEMPEVGGLTYVRWGRTTCGGDAELLYSGYAAGKKRYSTGFDRPGSGYICLHSVPEWGDVIMASVGSAELTGVEYLFDGPPFTIENLGGLKMRNQNMPCAVCHATTKTAQLMIPGKLHCPLGWNQEYWGYLASDSHIVSGNPFICLDQAPEAIDGGSADESALSQYVMPVEASCTALACPPYSVGYEISCTVCTK